jgi:hypothetical protein
MKGIHLFFKTFPVCLPMNYTTSRLWLPIRVIRKYKISSPGEWHSIHRNYFNPLVSWLMDKWKGSSYFYYLSRQFAHALHYIWVDPPTKRWHDKEENINTRTVTLLTHNLCAPLCNMVQVQVEGIHLFLLNLSRQFAHELHYFKLGHLPRSGIRKLKISSPRW